jgi:hypothetical protein
LDPESSSKLSQGADNDGKSDTQKSSASQENDSSARASGLVRRRKKKVFADYYYGDEIFSKPKNGSKREKKEKKAKGGKVKPKAKPHKTEKATEPNKIASKAKSKQALPSKNNEAASLDQSLLNLANSIVQNQAVKQVSNGQIDQSLLKSLNVSREIGEIQNGANNKVLPVKPIPQRLPGSNLGYLLNAHKISYMASNPPSLASLTASLEESMKKRDDKALGKNLQSLLLNSEASHLGSKPELDQNGLTDSLNALKSLGKSGGLPNIANGIGSKATHVSDTRKSSSEEGDNSKHRTPTKPNKRKKYDSYDDYGSGQKLTPKMHKSSSLKTPKKVRKQEKEPENLMRGSIVKETV